MLLKQTGLVLTFLPNIWSIWEWLSLDFTEVFEHALPGEQKHIFFLFLSEKLITGYVRSRPT